MTKLKTFILEDSLVIMTSAPREVVEGCLCQECESDEEWLEDVAQEIKDKGYECEHYFGEKL